MNTVLSQEDLQGVFDQILLRAMDTMAGIQLSHRATHVPSGELCTVHAAFERGFNSSLSLCADTAMLVRLTQSMMQEEEVAPEDVEDFTKEFFNVVCGHIAAELFAVTRIPSRFGIPAFYRGRYHPEELTAQFSLSYASDRNEFAQLTHHTPVSQ